MEDPNKRIPVPFLAVHFTLHDFLPDWSISTTAKTVPDLADGAVSCLKIGRFY